MDVLFLCTVLGEGIKKLCRLTCHYLVFCQPRIFAGFFGVLCVLERG